jgi:hypothetical protein
VDSYAVLLASRPRLSKSLRVLRLHEENPATSHSLTHQSTPPGSVQRWLERGGLPHWPSWPGEPVLVRLLPYLLVQYHCCGARAFSPAANVKPSAFASNFMAGRAGM